MERTEKSRAKLTQHSAAYPGTPDKKTRKAQHTEAQKT
jgi:hypothetical protein